MRGKFTLLVTLVFTFFSLAANAKIWRVNNNSNYNGSSLWGENLGGSQNFPVFAQLNQANDFVSVLSGDTIHVEGSSLNYAAANISKKLVIIGPGYFLDQNQQVSLQPLKAYIANIIFDPGSDGSQLMGMHVGANNSSMGVRVLANNILIKRNLIDQSINFSTTLVSDTRIVQNYFINSNGTNASAIEVSSSTVFPSSVVFNNNITERFLRIPEEMSLLECKNNVFDFTESTTDPGIQIKTGSFQNNILKSVNAAVNINSGSNNNVSFNIGGTNTQFGTTNNNLVANMANLFVASGTRDGKYQLKPGSAAGSDGAERGAFGGSVVASRYTLSGLPPVPVIYEITTTGVPGAAGIPITIKARTIK